jgi:hypothetical protein
MKYSPLSASLALAALCLTSGASAQKASSVQSDLQAFRKQAGNNWEAFEDKETGVARMIYGGNVKAAFTPSSDADYFLVARQHLNSTRSLFRVPASTLQENAVNFMPLGLTGSTDKVGVEFRQVVNGVVVRNGWMNVILDMQGRLLSADNTGLPQTGSINTSPTRSLEQAMAFAKATFEEQTGLAGDFIGEQELVIEQELVNGKRFGSLAWNVILTSEPINGEPASYRYLVSANADARVIVRENMIHHAAAPDVGGTIFGRVTPSDGPDQGIYQTVPLPYIRVSSPAGVVFTDANGNFNYPGITGPLKCRTTLRGPYVDVNLASGFDVVNVRTLTGTGNIVTLNKAPVEGSTSQMNAFLHINKMRDWTRSINPTDNMMDFVNLANVNILNTCNAFFSGFSTNYYNSGGSCPNTSYSSVIYHEQGHWQNVRYNSGNGPDGFGEGNADVFAVYQTNDPVVGRGFFGGSGGIRTGLNNRQFCGDSNGGCYGGVHANGEVLLGVLWKVRTNLQNSHGNQLGGDIANALHNGWMNGYNQSQIKNIIEFQWLVLDDNNGDLSDGTPNFADIDSAFLAQGFSGRTPPTTPGTITQYGLGAGGSNIGSIDSDSYPAAGGELVIDLSGFSASSTNASVIVSLMSTSTPGLGGIILTDLSQPVAMLPVPLSGGAGQATITIPLGAGGIVGYAQAIAGDSSQPSGLALSNGITIQIAD